MFEGKQISAVQESFILCRSKPNASYAVISYNKDSNLQQNACYILTVMEYAATASLTPL